jgi:hypothetical protein
MNEESGDGLVSRVSALWNKETLGCMEIPSHSLSSHNIACFAMMMNGKGLLMYSG